MFERILVVCVGNICRSPMAAALLERRLSERAPAPTVTSAGIAALVGRPADPIAIALLAERGLDLSAHRARQLTEELVMDADLVVAMTRGQVRSIEAMAPRARGRVHRLGRWGDFDVPDPYRRPRPVFEAALACIDRGIDDLERAFWRRR
jgi:protein-tyrosine phosphatase